MAVYLNDIPVVTSRFPNNEVQLVNVYQTILKSFKQDIPRRIAILLRWESNEDLLVLQLVRLAILDIPTMKNTYCYLDIPFFPYGQMDRAYHDKMFSLKYVAHIINSLQFDEVRITDPHSTVLPALINRCVCHYPMLYKAVSEVYYGRADILMFPDEGALKKYGHIMNDESRLFLLKTSMDDLSVIHGSKTRTTQATSSSISSYSLVMPDPDFVRGKKVVMVDDMVIGGRTFVEAAKALRDAGATHITLCVTHMMARAKQFYNSKGDGLIDEIISDDTLNMIPWFATPDPRP